MKSLCRRAVQRLNLDSSDLESKAKRYMELYQAPARDCHVSNWQVGKGISQQSKAWVYFAFHIHSFVVQTLNANRCGYAYFEKRKCGPSHTDRFVKSCPAACHRTWVHICQTKFSTHSVPAVISATLQETDSLVIHFKVDLPWKRNFFPFFFLV